MIHRSIRTRKLRRRIGDQFDLQLTTLIDVMVIILVFLLKSATVSTVQFSGAPGLELPYSVSKTVPPESLSITITPEAMTFESNRILDFAQSADSVAEDQFHYRFHREDLAENGKLIVPLYQALISAREKSELLRAKSKFRDEKGNPSEFFGELAVQADRRISYDTLRRVMYTSAAAGFKVFHLLAIQQEE